MLAGCPKIILNGLFVFANNLCRHTWILGENSFCKHNEEIIIDIFNMQSCVKIHFSENFQTAYSYTPILELESGCDRSSQPGETWTNGTPRGFVHWVLVQRSFPIKKGSKRTMMAAGGINLVPEVIKPGSFVSRNAEARIHPLCPLGNRRVEDTWSNASTLMMFYK